MASAVISAPDARLTPSSIWSNGSRTDDTTTILSQVESSISTEQAPAGADPVLSDVDKLVAAFVRVRGLNRLEGGIISRCWLAHDMKMSPDKLDSLLSLLRWRGLVRLPNPDIVIVGDADAMRDIALSCPPLPSVVVPLHRKKAA
ncbi:MAG: hypothetical protein ACR2PI_18545 [Hyphomicrobiaceae bacterium]